MGTFEYPITLTGPRGSVTLEAMIDTGATFSSFPASVLERLGVVPTRNVRLRLANGVVEDRPLGDVDATIDGVESQILCLFGPPGAPPLIGAHALEAFLLMVDPVQKRLVPAEGFLL